MLCKASAILKANSGKTLTDIASNLCSGKSLGYPHLLLLRCLKRPLPISLVEDARWFVVAAIFSYCVGA